MEPGQPRSTRRREAPLRHVLEHRHPRARLTEPITVLLRTGGPAGLACTTGSCTGSPRGRRHGEVGQSDAGQEAQPRVLHTRCSPLNTLQGHGSTLQQ